MVPVIPSLVIEVSALPPSRASLWMGLLLAAYAVMQFLCAPLLGALSDRFGRRPVLLASLTGMCLNYVMLVWAPSLAFLLLGRVLAGATAASYSTANAYIADVTPPAMRAQRFGLVGAMFGLGFVVGPALGGLLGGVWLRLPFVVAAVLAGANVLSAFFFLPESLSPALRRPFEWRRANPLGSLRAVAADPAFARLAVAWCCTWFALGMLQTSFVLANQVRLGWGEQQNGLALAWMGLGLAVVQGLLVRRIVRRLGERRAALAGYVLAGCGYIGLAFAYHVWVVLLAIVIQALGGISGPAVQAMVSARAGPDRQGALQGALSSLQGLTAIAAPVTGGLVFGFFTSPDAPVQFPGAAFLLGVAAYALAFVMVRGMMRGQRLASQ